MSYVFAGFFASPVVDAPIDLPDGAVWRNISAPFTGIGLRLPSLIGRILPAEEITALATALGLAQADRWLFLQYDCWGGQIDFVYGLGSANGEAFGPVEESDLEAVQSAYVGLMERFGVSSGQALHFPPFERGFWGET